MDINQLIGNSIRTVAGYAVQGFIYSSAIDVMNPKGVITVRQGGKLIISVSKKVNKVAKRYPRTNFEPETIFHEAIDTSFSAD